MACVLTAGLGLAACSDIDDMFGGASNDMSASAAPLCSQTRMGFRGVTRIR